MTERIVMGADGGAFQTTGIRERIQDSCPELSIKEQAEIEVRIIQLMMVTRTVMSISRVAQLFSDIADTLARQPKNHPYMQRFHPESCD
jgi:hypothetical protein